MTFIHSRIPSTLPKSTRLDTLRLTAYVGYLEAVDDPQDILNADWARFQSQLVSIVAGKTFFEFAIRMIYMGIEQCGAALDRLLTEKLDLLAKNPCISIVNLGYYVDTPHVSRFRNYCK